MPLFRRKASDVPIDRTLGDQRAARLAEGVAGDDLDAVRDVLGQPLDDRELERLTWVMTDVPGHPAIFDRWVEAEPDRALARLARGAYGVTEAWEIRGGAYADQVGEDAWDRFWDRLREAEADLRRAVEMDPEDGVAWCHLLTSARGLELDKDELFTRYEEAQSRAPWLVEVHLQLLQAVCEKWYGSDDESLRFARDVHRDAPDGAGARAVVPMAHLEVWVDMHRRDGAEPGEYAARAEVLEEIREAAARSVFADGFEDDLVGVPALNVFAAGLWVFGDEDRARELVQRLGTRRSEFPWVYLDDEPGRLYGRLLAG